MQQPQAMPTSTPPLSYQTMSQQHISIPRHMRYLPTNGWQEQNQNANTHPQNTYMPRFPRNRIRRKGNTQGDSQNYPAYPQNYRLVNPQFSNFMPNNQQFLNIVP